MSFKLTHSNSNGTFKIKLNRDVSEAEMEQLCKLANNLVPSSSSSSNLGPMGTPVYGPHLPPQQMYQQIFGDRVVTPNPNEAAHSRLYQNFLGEKPVDSINLGTYAEPEDGVRVKMVHCIKQNLVAAVKAFRAATGISASGCKEIIFGNHICPILTLEAAQQILADLRALDMFAKIVPAFAEDAA